MVDYLTVSKYDKNVNITFWISICEPCTDEGIQAEEEDLDASSIEDQIANKYLDEAEGEDEDDHSNNYVITDVATPKEEEQEPDDKTSDSEPVEQVWTNLSYSVTSIYLIACAFAAISSSPGSTPGLGNCVLFLGKNLNSHNASLHSGV